MHASFINHTFISNARLKLAKIQAKAKQQPEVELFLFQNYLLSSSTLSYKNNRDIPKNAHKTSASVLTRLYN